ncbi:MAG: hypothetical protein V7K36_14570 [Nostoc sp.]
MGNSLNHLWSTKSDVSDGLRLRLSYPPLCEIKSQDSVYSL